MTLWVQSLPCYLGEPCTCRVHPRLTSTKVLYYCLASLNHLWPNFTLSHIMIQIISLIILVTFTASKHDFPLTSCHFCIQRQIYDEVIHKTYDFLFVFIYISFFSIFLTKFLSLFFFFNFSKSTTQSLSTCKIEKIYHTTYYDSQKFWLY